MPVTAFHDEFIEHDRKRRRECAGHAHLQIAADRGSAGTDTRYVSRAVPTIGRTSIATPAMTILSLGIASPAMRPSTTKTNAVFIVSEGNKPGDDCEQNVESAGEPADFRKHISPSNSSASEVPATECRTTTD
jgi:hypothetical protein